MCLILSIQYEKNRELFTSRSVLEMTDSMLVKKYHAFVDSHNQEVGVRVPVEARIFTSSYLPDQLLGPPNLLSKWAPMDVSPGVKRPERETGHSPPTFAEVKEIRVYTSTPPYIFMP
jgi:hypothetical protein